MININGKEISQIIINTKEISSIRIGDKLVWEAINSCFGKGYWIDNKPWSNKDGWRN